MGAAPPRRVGPDRRDDEAAPPAEDPPAPLLELRDGLPPLTDTDHALRVACDALARADGPVAIDAERASGYRYSARAYLVQLRRGGSGSVLFDPIPFGDLTPLQEALGDYDVAMAVKLMGDGLYYNALHSALGGHPQETAADDGLLSVIDRLMPPSP